MLEHKPTIKEVANCKRTPVNINKKKLVVALATILSLAENLGNGAIAK